MILRRDYFLKKSFVVQFTISPEVFPGLLVVMSFDINAWRDGSQGCVNT